MYVDAVSSTGSTAATGTQTGSSTSSEMDGVDEDAFMQLLLAQLQNQDPLEPMDDTDFMAQLAQFNSLNQLTQMNERLGEILTSQTLAQGSAMIGKMVTGLSYLGELVTGVVTGLYLENGSVILDVDGTSVPLDAVHSVEEAPVEETET